MNKPIQVFDGDGLVPIDPEDLYSQFWECEEYTIGEPKDTNKFNVAMRGPTPDTVLELLKIKQYLLRGAEIVIHMAIRRLNRAAGTNWGAIRIVSIEKVEHTLHDKELWAVRGLQ